MASLSRAFIAVLFCLFSVGRAATPGLPTEWLYSNIPPTITTIELVADTPMSTYYVDGNGALFNVVGAAVTPIPGVTGIKALAPSKWSDCAFALLENGAVAPLGNYAPPPPDPNFPAPPLEPDLTPPASLTNVISIGVGANHAAAVKSDGTVHVWGQTQGTLLLPADGLTNVVKVDCGSMNVVALKSNGTLEGWGQNIYGESVFPRSLTNVVDVAAGSWFTVALLNDGSVRVFGDPAVQPSTTVTNVKSIAAGFDYWLALKNDGSVESWPSIDFRGLKRVTRIHANFRHVICWTVAPMIWDHPTNQVTTPGTSVTLSVRAVSDTPLSYQWYFNDNPVTGATGPAYELAATQEHSGEYWVRVTNTEDFMNSKKARVVIGKPAVAITSPPVECLEGGSVIFTTDTISPSPVTFQWLFDGIEISNATSGSLTLANLGPSQTGMYSVRAENEFGATVSAPVQLTVKTTLPPSVNDAFSAASSINGFPYSFEGNIRTATREPNEPSIGAAGAQTLWWSFTPSEKGVLTFSVDAAWSGAVIQAFRGTSLNSLVHLPSDGAHVLVESGMDYHFQLSTSSATPPEGGDFKLVASFERTGANDDFAFSVQVEGASNVVRDWIASPTIEPSEPLIKPDVIGTLWWSWAAPTNGRVEITPRGNMAVYSGPTLDRLTLVRSQGSVTVAPLIFSATAGSIYHIQMYAQADNSFEATGFDLNFFPYTPATNDNFVDASYLDGAPKSNLGATRELGEPMHRTGGPNKSLWWTFTAGENRTEASVRLGAGTVTNATLAVYQGATVDTLRLINKTNGPVVFETSAGETYHVCAETAADETGDFVINFLPGKQSIISHLIPGNIIQNPSFEEVPSAAWSGQSGGAVNEVGADGRNYAVIVQGFLQQDNITTVVGRSYRLRYVFYGSPLIVDFGGTELSPKSVSPPGPGWQTAEYFVTPATAVNRLHFRGTGWTFLDQISLVPLDEPAAIISQPLSTTAFEGAPVTFHAGITGAEPLSRQWYFNGMPVDGAKDVSFHIPAVTSADAGTYYVIAINSFGQIESDRVTLTVESARSPQIVLHPQGDHISLGQYVVLQSAAVGTAPLNYQWFHNDVAVPDGTNAALVISSFAATNTGSYAVRVSNAAESVTSLSATLALTDVPVSGGGIVWFANDWYDFPPVSVPVFDVDGVTRVAGTNFVAQLYAGTSVETLRAVGRPRSFQTGFSYGLWRPETVTLPTIAAGAEALVQVRVWQASAGSSYEMARALGGKFGRSETMRVIAGAHPPLPLPEAGSRLVGLRSFHLRAGLPNFVTGNLTLVEVRSDGTMVWQLTGAAGFRYLVERQTNNGKWEPFITLLNESGLVTFTDVPASGAETQLYRARMLD